MITIIQTPEGLKSLCKRIDEEVLGPNSVNDGEYADFDEIEEYLITPEDLYQEVGDWLWENAPKGTKGMLEMKFPVAVGNESQCIDFAHMVNEFRRLTSQNLYVFHNDHGFLCFVASNEDEVTKNLRDSLGRS